MNLLKRLKNLWKLSAFTPNEKLIEQTHFLVKDFPTIEKKLATIIKEPINYFEENDNTNK